MRKLINYILLTRTAQSIILRGGLHSKPPRHIDTLNQQNGKSLLLCVITGQEHSGTTLLSQLLNGHPDIASGVECGFLLSDITNFNLVTPFYDWLSSTNWGWGVTKEDRDDILSSSSYTEMYDKLHRYSGRLHEDDRLKLIFKNSKYIYDKTPRYVYWLPEIMRKINRPFIVTLKTPREAIESNIKRGGNTKKILHSQYAPSLLNIKSALQEHPDRLLIVSYKSLASNHESIINRVKLFIGLDDEVLLNIDQYNKRFGTHINSKNSFKMSHVKYSPPSSALSASDQQALQAFELKHKDVLKYVYSKTI